MAPPTHVTLEDVENAMRTAFFVSSGTTATDEIADDPPISTPDVLKFESRAKQLRAHPISELLSKYSNHYGSCQGLKAEETNPLQLLFRRTKWQMLMAGANSAAIWEKIKSLQELLESSRGLLNKLAQTDRAEEAKNALAKLDTIHYLRGRAEMSVNSMARVAGSGVRQLDILENAISGGEFSRAFDSSLDPVQRINSFKSGLQKIYGNWSTRMPDTQLYGSALSFAQFKNQADSTLAALQDVLIPTQHGFDIESRMPDLSHLEDFHFEQLPTETSIRLLRFGQDFDSATPNSIRLLLHVVDLNDNPEYNALSYVWGDHRPALGQRFHPERHKRLFQVTCNNRKVSVTYNLFCALKRLSRSCSDTLREVRAHSIWIDQFCVNQRNFGEVRQQVAVMDRVYRQAEKVVSWLGEEDIFTDNAIQLLDRLADIPSEEYRSPRYTVAPLVHSIPSEQWLALSSLLSRPYFKRAWVVQEIAFADNILIFCGERIILLENLAKCLRFLHHTKAWTLLTKHTAVFRSANEHMQTSRWQPQIRFGQHASALLDTRETVMLNKLLPEDLLLLGRRFDSTDAKDKYYAMLGLARAGLRNVQERDDLPPAQYESSVDEVAVSFASYHIKRSRGLGILSFVEDGTHRIGKCLPSWVPSPAAPLLPRPFVVENTSDDNLSPWNPSGSRGSMKLPDINGNVLTVEGFHIDIIKRAAIPFNEIVKNDPWSDVFDLLEHLKMKTISGITSDIAFVRTLIADKDHALGKNAASTKDLLSDFREWVISLIYSTETSGKVDYYGAELMAADVSAFTRLDDMKFDLMTLGKDAKDTIAGQKPGRTGQIESILESLQLYADLGNKYHRDIKLHLVEQSAKVADQLQASIVRLWEANPDGAFCSLAHIRKTISALHPSQVGSPEHIQVQERIDRFKAALGTKLDSRRIFSTGEDRLGLGPQSLEEGDEIWLLKGANVPFVLRKLGNGNFTLVGEAFVFGVMHGEAVMEKNGDAFCEIRLE